MTSIYNNYNINSGFNLPKINFRSNPAVKLPQPVRFGDGYVSNPLFEKFGTKSEIEASAKSNPRIQEIMQEYNLPIKVNENELQKLKYGHLQGTRVMAAKIYSNLPTELKNEVNPAVLQEAAMFHDYGKVLIPDRILNKNGELTEKEWGIMQQHSELGSELLAKKDISPRTKELIKYHHVTKDGNGYPKDGYNYEYGLDSEILAVADKYQALMEERSYKKAMTKEEALAIIEKDVGDGIVSGEVFDALKKAV